MTSESHGTHDLNIALEAAADNRITTEELVSLFGPSLPMEALRVLLPEQFVKHGEIPHFDPLPIVREKLRKIAAQRSEAMTQEARELVAEIQVYASQLERAADGASFVADGYVRVKDPGFLVGLLARTAAALDKLAEVERERDEARFLLDEGGAAYRAISDLEVRADAAQARAAGRKPGPSPARAGRSR